MLDRILKYNYSLIGILILVLSLKVVLYYLGYTDSGNYDSSILLSIPTNTLWSGLLSGVFIVSLGIFIIYIIEKYNNHSRFSYWQVLIFTLLLSHHNLYGFSIEYIGLLALIISHYFIYKDISILKENPHVNNIFNIAIILGLGSMFTPHLLLLLPFFWISSLTIGIAPIRGLIALLLGCALPYAFADAYIFIFKSDNAQFTYQLLIKELQQTTNNLQFVFSSWEQLYLAIPFILLIFSVFCAILQIDSNKFIPRKFNTINIILIVYTIIIMVLQLMPIHLGGLILSSPIAYFISTFQNNAKPLTQTIVLVLLIISVCISYPIVINSIVSLIENIF